MYIAGKVEEGYPRGRDWCGNVVIPSLGEYTGIKQCLGILFIRIRTIMMLALLPGKALCTASPYTPMLGL
jgi:hypothetical protein